ncbi:MAG: hypothetical protein R6W89_08025 [Candidatus Hydrogenedentota bacterium]
MADTRADSASQGWSDAGPDYGPTQDEKTVAAAVGGVAVVVVGWITYIILKG